MCGIAGFIDFNCNTSQQHLQAMVKSLNHRGPDDSGVELFTLPNVIIGFGQARLSIIDLSNGGHQPMNYQHLSIVFNGEIYNYAEIKNELIACGHTFISASDTEVLLHAYFQWGRKAIEKFTGMFAIVLFDRVEGEIIMITDRPGVKPLYYYWDGSLLLFASELKAFHTHPSFVKEIDSAAVSLFFNFGYIPSPHCIFTNCNKLPAGNILTLTIRKKTFVQQVYWDVHEFYKKEKSKLSYDDAKSQLHGLLLSACNYRMVADVPVGVFLSGGYDSTAVCALLQTNRTEKLKTFTIGFEEGNNEAPFAKQTADFLGTDHTEYICTTKEAQDIIPTLPFFYDEPFADSSAIPTILVSRQARKQVTVALSADGGDEMFAGYSTYSTYINHLRLMNKIPGNLKSIAGFLLSMSEKCTPVSNVALKHKLYGASKALSVDKSNQAAVLFNMMNSLPKTYNENLFRKAVPFNYTYVQNSTGYQHDAEIAMGADYQVYLANDILTKVDRATMSVSLEGREPLLDHHLIEFVAQLPLHFKFDTTGSKRILKDIVHEYIPKEMMNRPKAGFSLPISKWLLSNLAYLVDEYLNENALKQSGLFNLNFVQEQIKLFKDKKLHRTPFIWYLLMFQMWYKKWM